MSMKAKTDRLNWPSSRFGGPMIIGHRGACYHEIENTLTSFDIAHQLGADMWEIDIRLTKDGTCVVCHDDDLNRIFGVDARISQLTAQELSDLPDAHVPTLQEVIVLAQHMDAGLYIEIKGEGSGPVALQELNQNLFTFAALGSFNADYVAELADMNCPYPLSVLVRVGEDPFEQARKAKADAIHLCWERASDHPDALLTDGLLAQAQQEKLEIILWHEERPDVINALTSSPLAEQLNGICTDRPELFVPYGNAASRPASTPKGPEICCHRGINHLAPENTIAAAKLTFEQDLDWLEIDIHQTSDNHLTVIHDHTLDRTTNGTGPVKDKTLEQLRALDAGAWFSSFHVGEKIPTFEEIILLAKGAGKRLYVEIKEADPALVLEMVNRHDFLKDCFFWSFDWPCIKKLRHLSPEANIMARTLDFASPQEAINDIGASIIELNMKEDFETLAPLVKQSSAKLMLCYQGTDLDIFETMIRLKPDMINLNHSHIWKEVWHQHNQPKQTSEAAL